MFLRNIAIIVLFFLIGCQNFPTENESKKDKNELNQKDPHSGQEQNQIGGSGSNNSGNNAPNSGLNGQNNTQGNNGQKNNGGKKNSPPPPPPPPSAATKLPTLAIGKLSAKIYQLDKNNKSYYAAGFFKKNTVLTMNEFVDLLSKTDKDSFDLRTLLTDVIASFAKPKNYEGYEIKWPILNNLSKNDPAFFIAFVSKPASKKDTFNDYFLHCTHRPVTNITNQYAQRFINLFAYNFTTKSLNTVSKSPSVNGTFINVDNATENGSVVFVGEAKAPDIEQIMVSPCPQNSTIAHNDNNFLGHIYSFVSEIKNKNTYKYNEIGQNFWLAVGQTARKMFDGNTHVKNINGGKAKQDQLFLSLHGLGVGWLHFRVEIVPRYYKYLTTELTDSSKAKELYDEIF